MRVIVDDHAARAAEDGHTGELSAIDTCEAAYCVGGVPPQIGEWKDRDLKVCGESARVKGIGDT
jgi:hypothetical protein